MKYSHVIYRYTRDDKVPLEEGDVEFTYGWRCVPVPPGPEEEGWQIADSSHDRKTLWFRHCTTTVMRAKI
jgi:hypothetical protein